MNQLTVFMSLLLLGAHALPALSDIFNAEDGAPDESEKELGDPYEIKKSVLKTYKAFLVSNGKSLDDSEAAFAYPTAESTTTEAKAVGDILAHGGPVMVGPNKVYLIWYGNWAGNTATSILPAFLNSLGGSPWYSINSQYSSIPNVAPFVSTGLTLAGQINDAYSQGTALSDARIGTIVGNAINSGRLPRDSNAVYFVLTSQDVTATSGFCTTYCGWHSAGMLSGTAIKYSFVGNPARCPSMCSVQAISPNGNAGADAMASILAHELAETVTDPLLNAWYDAAGEENADKCSWTFGTLFALSTGARYNVVLGGRPYLIQQNWKLLPSQGCGMS